MAHETWNNFKKVVWRVQYLINREHGPQKIGFLSASLSIQKNYYTNLNVKLWELFLVFGGDSVHILMDIFWHAGRGRSGGIRGPIVCRLCRCSHDDGSEYPALLPPAGA